MASRLFRGRLRRFNLNCTKGKRVVRPDPMCLTLDMSQAHSHKGER